MTQGSEKNDWEAAQALWAKVGVEVEASHIHIELLCEVAHKIIGIVAVDSDVTSELSVEQNPLSIDTRLIENEIKHQLLRRDHRIRVLSHAVAA